MFVSPPGPPRVIIESQTSNKSGCLWLLCELDGLDSAQVNITWSRNGQIISETNSSLHVCNHEWSEGDTFTCNASQFSSYTDLSASITITQNHTRVDDSKYSHSTKIIIICGGALTGTLVLIFLVICIYKCKKAHSNDASIVYTNKVYENFSFSTTGQQTQRNVSTQQEQCVYEN
ncbi:hypothetical protein ANANG_G00155460 [Anguilla anguilla]|uniref:Ig-like domain-containing protein n=1 Tax=Anguilla anguilla TaxID=7936 RepID=A0A9D3RUD1_ANGAN|nr:hypothetical protein ANANG_G00155460 [Anguilla anguilla]